MQAVILSIGDELALGQTVDTNSAYLAARLARMGVSVRYHHTVADDLPDVRDAIAQAARDAKLVLITGGLGPTEDDLTRQALAQAMGVDLVLDEKAVDQIDAFFARRGREMPARNRVQAMHPRGAQLIPNDHGTAPGIEASLGSAEVFVMPGVPREMVRMFEDRVEQKLAHLLPNRKTILTTKISTFGAGESAVADMLGAGLMDRARNPKVGTTVANAIVSVRLRSEFPTADEAQRQLDETAEQIRQRLGALIFAEDEQSTLAHALGSLLAEKQRELVVAESCTGGLVGAMMTDVAGSSDYFVGGWITYTNDMKQRELGVAPALLETHGAVSEPVARAMAAGALERAPEADASLAITGIAGPGGATPDKPVGSVWVALGQREDRAVRTQAVLLKLSGDRVTVRDRAAKSALQLLRFELMGEPLTRLDWGQVFQPVNA